MKDHAEWLRRQASKEDMLTCEDMLQAADEIERLKVENERLQTIERSESIMKLKVDLNADQIDMMIAKHLKRMYKQMLDYNPVTEEDKKEFKKDLKAVRRVHNYLTAQENHI